MNAIWGALVGDACGATLEGAYRPTTEDVDRALTLPGGGCHRVGPGQITDDGELTIALHRAMLYRGTTFPLEAVAAAYAAWYESTPFDMGRTCSMAFERLSEWVQEGSDPLTLEDALRTIDEYSHTSEANGAMMRATPMAVWWAAHPLSSPDETALHAAADAQQDASLSHPSPVARRANALYVYALTLLLLGRTPSEVAQRLDEMPLAKGEDAEMEADAVIRGWIQESKREWSTLADAHAAMGHVRHGWVMALWFLRHPEITFREAMRLTLSKGGDTDTNAAIVGGMVACYQSIPEEMVARVRAFRADEEGRWPMRPREYTPHLLAE
jgi:ADP-ribosyl-[dinitrogen reductase] hydrolase